jgi:hypothetical protein
MTQQISAKPNKGEMNMKQVLLITLLTVFAALFTACGNEAETQPPESLADSPEQAHEARPIFTIQVTEIDGHTWFYETSGDGAFSLDWAEDGAENISTLILESARSGRAQVNLGFRESGQDGELLITYVFLFQVNPDGTVELVENYFYGPTDSPPPAPILSLMEHE